MHVYAVRQERLGSAAIEAALSDGEARRIAWSRASWETNDAFRDLLKINPIGQIPTLGLPDGSGLSKARRF
jgi:GST-like protein